jgi:hypothetical protein
MKGTTFLLTENGSLGQPKIRCVERLLAPNRFFFFRASLFFEKSHLLIYSSTHPPLLFISLSSSPLSSLSSREEGRSLFS